MSFELFTLDDVEEFPSNNEDLRVRFLFRNGSDSSAPLRPYPIFARGSQDSMTLEEFGASMKEIAIMDDEQWCKSCHSDLPFCAAYGISNPDSVTATESGLSNSSRAGIIGASVGVGTVLIVAAIAYVVLRLRRRSHTTPEVMASGKASVYSSDSDTA